MNKPHPRLAEPLLILFLGIGLLLMIGSTVFFSYYHSRTAGRPDTEGTVAFFEDGYPVIQYTVDGTPFQIRGPRGDKNPLRQNDVVTVYFPEDNPARGRLHSWMLQWFFPGAFGFVGLRFTWASIMAIAQGWRCSSQPTRK